MSKTCDCPVPRPGYDLRRGAYVCSNCKGIVLPIASKRPPPDFTPVGGPSKMVEPKWFAFECPECEHNEVYFQQRVTPVGEARCQLCGKVIQAARIIEIRETRERQYQEKQKNPMMRTLDLAPGTHGKCCGEEEE